MSIVTDYYISPIAIGFFLIYALSFLLYKLKLVKVTTHRKIWNVLLMVTFLVTGVFGLLLTVQVQYGLPFTIPINMLFWHVEAGIVMTLISFFHLAWHFKYYARMLRTSRSRMREAETAERRPALRGIEPGQVAYAPERVRTLERR